jgi:integrase
MGSITKEANGTWTVRYDFYEGNRRRQKMKRGFGRRADAAAYLTQAESEILGGTYATPSEELFTDYVEGFIRRRYTERAESGRGSHNTEEYYKNLFNERFREYFKGRRLGDISTRDIERYLAFLSEQTWAGGGRRLSDKSVWKHYKAIRTVFAHAVKKRDAKANPCDGAEMPFGEQGMATAIRARPLFWEPSAIAAAEKIFEGTEIEWHVRFTLRTGLREGEVCALKESDFDFGAMTFTVSEQAQHRAGAGIVFTAPKSAASADVLPMTGEIARMAKAKINENRKNRLRYGQKYNTEHAGRLSLRPCGDFLNPKYLYHLFRSTLLKHPEIPYITFHGLRHTCAVWHIEAGTDMKTLQKLLRHSEYQVTVDTYADASMRLKREAMERLSLAGGAIRK